MSKSIEEGMSNINYWLHAIAFTEGHKCPVAIVGTHLDDKKFEVNPSLVEQYENQIIDQFSKFQNIRAIVSASCLTGRGMEFLR